MIRTRVLFIATNISHFVLSFRFAKFKILLVKINLQSCGVLTLENLSSYFGRIDHNFARKDDHQLSLMKQNKKTQLPLNESHNTRSIFKLKLRFLSSDVITTYKSQRMHFAKPAHARY